MGAVVVHHLHQIAPGSIPAGTLVGRIRIHFILIDKTYAMIFGGEMMDVYTWSDTGVTDSAGTKKN